MRPWNVVPSHFTRILGHPRRPLSALKQAPDVNQTNTKQPVAYPWPRSNLSRGGIKHAVQDRRPVALRYIQRHHSYPARTRPPPPALRPTVFSILEWPAPAPAPQMGAPARAYHRPRMRVHSLVTRYAAPPPLRDSLHPPLPIRRSSPRRVRLHLSCATRNAYYVVLVLRHSAILRSPRGRSWSFLQPQMIMTSHSTHPRLAITNRPSHPLTPQSDLLCPLCAHT